MSAAEAGAADLGATVRRRRGGAMDRYLYNSGFIPPRSLDWSVSSVRLRVACHPKSSRDTAVPVNTYDTVVY